MFPSNRAFACLLIASFVSFGTGSLGLDVDTGSLLEQPDADTATVDAPSGHPTADALVVAASSASATTVDPFDEAAALVQTAAYQELEAILSLDAGFLGMAPSLDGSQVITAAFSGTVPAWLPTPPAGWTLETHGGTDFLRMRTPIAGVIDIDDLTQQQRDGIPPLPEDAVGLGPGTPISQYIPGEGWYICSANFVFEQNGKYYLGSAGHCFLSEDAEATHGAGADYNANGVIVEACIDFCYFGGYASHLFGDIVTLGDVVYARQTGPGGDVGNDFGLVEIPSQYYDLIRPEMPMWDGPTGLDGNEGFAPVVHYGNGIDAGTFMASKGRAGLGLNDGDSKSWQAAVVINGGDSGSGINHGAAALAADGFEGTDALGIVTHGIGVVVAIPGLGFGTTIEHAIDMATQAGMHVNLVLEGGTIDGGGPGPDPEPTKFHIASIDLAYKHYGKNGHRITTTVVIEDENNAPFSGASVSISTTSPEGTGYSCSGTTGTDGSMSCQVQQKNRGHGTWESCVTSISASGATHDPLADAETCDTTSVS